MEYSFIPSIWEKCEWNLELKKPRRNIMVTQRNHNYDKLDVSGTCKSLYRKLYFQ